MLDRELYSGGGVLRDRRLRDSSRAIRSNTRSIYISGITGQGILKISMGTGRYPGTHGYRVLIAPTPALDFNHSESMWNNFFTAILKIGVDICPPHVQTG